MKNCIRDPCPMGLQDIVTVAHIEVPHIKQGAVLNFVEALYSEGVLGCFIVLAYKFTWYPHTKPHSPSVLACLLSPST